MRSQSQAAQARSGDAELWRKAAVLGSLWAASEIVLGSFLHNTRAPLSGHLLTGIGIAILVAGHRLWPQRGLLWRAGLICAAMKSVSPSAVIISPMVAISIEGLLAEAGVLLGGANPLGYLLAGGLAMSWPLFHTLGGMFLIYGPETVALYAQGLERLRQWLGLASGSPWPPVLALWACHVLGGGLAAGIGLRVGRKDFAPLPASPRATLKPPQVQRPAAGRSHSLPALLAHAAFLVAAMSWGSQLPVWGLAVAAAAYTGACISAYPRAASLLRRFGLWSGILLVSVLAGLVLGRWEAGLQMTLRALILTVGFSCVGEELCHPALKRALERGGGHAFFEALEQAFATLPSVFAGLPPGPQLLRSPVASLRAAVARAPALLEALSRSRLFLVTGERGEGKSALVASLAQAARDAGWSVGGILAPGFWEQGRRGGFDVLDLGTGEKRPLARKEGPPEWQGTGPFRFSPEGLALGRRALAEALRRQVDVLIVDEVGPLELSGQGWAPELDELARERRQPMVWVVRPSLVEEVRRRWGLVQARVCRADEESAQALLAELLGRAAAPRGA